jgi:hypothetical protein
MKPLPTDHPFALAAERVRRRVLVRRWLGLLEKSVRWVALAGLLWGLLIVWTGAGWLVGWALAAGMAWLLGALGWAWRKLPGDYAVWALWDEAAGRREAFAAAWWFEQQGEAAGEAGRLHWQQQRERMAEALPQLAVDLPLPAARWMGWLMGGGVAVLLSWVSLPAVEREALLTPEMQTVAAEQARRLSSERPNQEALAALAEEDKKRLATLLAEAAAALQNSDEQTVRGVMDALEKRARETEKLGQRLAAEGVDWASPALTEALRQQADTADLGDAVADKAAALAAKAAARLAEQIEGAKDQAEVAERLQEVLAEARAKADAEDAQRLVGGPVLQAGDQMQAQDAAGAADALRRLSESLREVEQRELAQEELQRLAESLREAGAMVANGGAESAMQALAGVNEQGQSGTAGQGQSEQVPQVGQQAGESGETPPALGMMPPGLSQPAAGGKQEEGAGQQAPPLGKGQPMLGMAESGQQGQSPPGQGDGKDKPQLLAPVPGQPQGKPEGPPVLLPGQSGEPGMSLQMPGSGLPPGAGKAELMGEGTEAQETARQALVNAQTNAEGFATLRQVEGRNPGQEQAQRQGTAAAVEFLEAQEQALDEAVLPVIRREQVRRYFNELRRRLEKEP